MNTFQQFIDTVKITQETKDFDSLYTVMCDVFHISSIHPSVKSYIESTINTESIAGAVYFEGFAKTYKRASPINYYYSDNSIEKERLLPALPFAYTENGHEYYLFLKSGQVLGGHHDTLWNDCFDRLFIKNQGNVNEALDDLLAHYALCTFTYAQFLKMQTLCREHYGIHSPKEFPGKLTGDDFVKILIECGKDEAGQIICYIDDIVCSNTLEGLIDYFDDFGI